MKTVNDASPRSDMIGTSQRSSVAVCLATEWSHPSQPVVASPGQMGPSYAGRAAFITMDFDGN